MNSSPILTISDERQAELDKLSYRGYLNSPEWGLIRQAKLQVQPWCELCGSTAALQIHHSVYPERRGGESLSMLTVLCDSCHTVFHHRLTVSDPRLQGLRLILQNERNPDWVWALEGYRAQLLEEGISTTEQTTQN